MAGPPLVSFNLTSRDYLHQSTMPDRVAFATLGQFIIDVFEFADDKQAVDDQVRPSMPDHLRLPRSATRA